MRVRIINADAAIKFHVRQEVALAALGKEFEAGVIPDTMTITLPDSDFDGWFFPAGSYEIVTP